MDTITLTGVHANGTHGVLTFEHERPQTFVVDVTLHLDLAAAGPIPTISMTPSITAAWPRISWLSSKALMWT